MATSATGRVKRLYAYSGGAYIQLDYKGVQPKGNYFHLGKNHENYNALYSLAMIAAVHRYPLRVRASKTIVNTAHAQVVYMLIDW